MSGVENHSYFVWRRVMELEVKYNGKCYKATRVHVGLLIWELNIVIPMIMKRPGVLSLAC